MRLTPAKPCHLKAGKIFSRAKTRADTTTCTLFACSDAGGSPGTAVAMKSYFPFTNLTSGKWDTVYFDSPPQFNSDFWIGYRIPLRGGSNYQDSVYITLDTQCNYPDMNKGSSDFSTWATPASIPGDIMIRAIVEYQAVEEASTTKILTLNQNSPNPVLKKATISYILPENMKVKLEIYDATGSVVNTLVNEIQSAGNREVAWNKMDANGKPVSSGIYFYRLSTDTKTITKTMIVL